MKKIIAVSDSHGNRDLLRNALSQAAQGSPIDLCVHCGDGVRDMDSLTDTITQASPHARVYSARGNCDLASFDVPTLTLFEANGVPMMVTHGHLFGVKHELESLLCVAEARKAKVVFFGHTHHPFLETVRGITLINPGAICAQMPGNIAYAQVLVDAGGKVLADLMKWLD